MVRFLVSSLLLIVSLTASTEVYAATLGDYMEVTNGDDERSKEQILYYIAGVTDALMYANEALIPYAKGKKSVCFPDPIPSRKSLYTTFRSHAEKTIEVGGIEKASNISLDQLIYASWMHAYPCRQGKKEMKSLIE
jgi:hypothetical protein